VLALLEADVRITLPEPVVEETCTWNVTAARPLVIKYKVLWTDR
jgi:hypothetical protein